MQNTEKFDVNDFNNQVTARSLLKSKEWLTTKEAAFYMDVSIPTLNTWVKRSAVTKNKIVGKNYFNRAKLDAVRNDEEGGLTNGI